MRSRYDLAQTATTGLLAAATAGLLRAAAGRSCFATGTPLLTPTGPKSIELLQVGDLILSRSEDNPHGPLEAKQVEEVFVRSAPLLHVHVDGQVIRTTAEHPFFAYNRGWVAAGALRVGDRLASHDGQWTAIQDVLKTDDYETVYNLRVAEYDALLPPTSLLAVPVPSQWRPGRQ